MLHWCNLCCCICGMKGILSRRNTLYKRIEDIHRVSFISIHNHKSTQLDLLLDSVVSISGIQRLDFDKTSNIALYARLRLTFKRDKTGNTRKYLLFAPFVRSFARSFVFATLEKKRTQIFQTSRSYRYHPRIPPPPPSTPSSIYVWVGEKPTVYVCVRFRLANLACFFIPTLVAKPR